MTKTGAMGLKKGRDVAGRAIWSVKSQFARTICWGHSSKIKTARHLASRFTCSSQPLTFSRPRDARGRRDISSEKSKEMVRERA